MILRREEKDDREDCWRKMMDDRTEKSNKAEIM